VRNLSERKNEIILMLTDESRAVNETAKHSINKNNKGGLKSGSYNIREEKGFLQSIGNSNCVLCNTLSPETVSQDEAGDHPS
jgi:hypothetical protein